MFSMSTLPRSAAFHTGVTSPCIRYQQYSVMQLKLTWWHSSKCNITILWDEIPAQSRLYSVRIIIMTHTNPQWTHNVHWTGLNQVWRCSHWLCINWLIPIYLQSYFQSNKLCVTCEDWRRRGMPYNHECSYQLSIHYSRLHSVTYMYLLFSRNCAITGKSAYWGVAIWRTHVHMKSRSTWWLTEWMWLLSLVHRVFCKSK